MNMSYDRMVKKVFPEGCLDVRPMWFMPPRSSGGWRIYYALQENGILKSNDSTVQTVQLLMFLKTARSINRHNSTGTGILQKNLPPAA